MRILLVEDDRSLQRTLVRLFKTQNFAVDATALGKEAAFLAKTNDYDVVVLDIMLPDIREEGVKTPVMMLTALDEVDNKIKGLDTGADDYLPKPFHAGELLARVRALARRLSDEKTSVLKIEDLELDTAARKAFRKGKDLKLSAKEFAMLEYLMINHKRIVSRSEISEHVWDLNFDPRSNVIDAFVKLLRRKVDAGFEHKLIRTVRGIGYTLSSEDPFGGGE
jgi:DNA-binding response OmpR family regulator